MAEISHRKFLYIQRNCRVRFLPLSRRLLCTANPHKMQESDFLCKVETIFIVHLYRFCIFKVTTMAGGVAFGRGVIVIWIALTVTSGEEVHWNNSAGGIWSVASNWDLGRMPNSHDDVFIDAGNLHNILHSLGVVCIDLLIDPEFLMSICSERGKSHCSASGGFVLPLSPLFILIQLRTFPSLFLFSSLNALR